MLSTCCTLTVYPIGVKLHHGAAVVLFNMKLQILRGDLGLPFFPVTSPPPNPPVVMSHWAQISAMSKHGPHSTSRNRPRPSLWVPINRPVRAVKGRG